MRRQHVEDLQTEEDLCERQARTQAEDIQRLLADMEAERQRQDLRDQASRSEWQKWCRRTEQARKAALRELAEAADSQQVVEDFLKARGFKQLGTPLRKTFWGASVYPLHLAVEENNL